MCRVLNGASRIISFHFLFFLFAPFRSLPLSAQQQQLHDVSEYSPTHIWTTTNPTKRTCAIISPFHSSTQAVLRNLSSLHNQIHHFYIRWCDGVGIKPAFALSLSFVEWIVSLSLLSLSGEHGSCASIHIRAEFNPKFCLSLSVVVALFSHDIELYFLYDDGTTRGA